MARDDLEAVLGFPVSDEQWACISAPLEPFVIVAGAGTGKTTVMAARVLWLVASGLAAEHEVLGLTFTNKAAAELAHRVSTLLAEWRRTTPADRDDVPGEPTIATYHSFARRLIDEQGLRVGIEPGARLLSEAAVAQLAYRLVCLADSLSAATHMPTRVAADVVRLDANLAEQTITTDELRAHDRDVIAAIDEVPRPIKDVREIRDTARRRIELADLVDQLRQARRDVGGLDFSDHMRLCVELVRSSPELVATMRRTYPVVLLDEYQDTSIAQRVILSTLFAGTGVTAVGDPLQAIYGWRSASVANIAAFGSHFGGDGNDTGGAPVRVLSLNRRSGEAILAAANDVAADLRSAHPQVAALAAPAPRAASVRAALLPTIADEQEWVVAQVADLVAGGRPPEQIAVLARTNAALAPIQQALVGRGIPASISGVAALTASPYAMAVLATLRVLADPADNTALVSLLAGPRWRIGPRDLELLGRQAATLAGPSDGGAPAAPAGLADRLRAASSVPDPVERPSLLEAAADPPRGISHEARGRLAEFLGEVRGLQRRVGEALPELVARVVAVTGAQVEADLRAGPTGVGDVGLAGLMQLVDGFADVDGRTGLGAFLAYLDSAERLGSEEEVDLPTIPGAVQLMTMHKAKGLEFPVVVLPHVCADVFPAKKGSDRWTTQAHVVPIDLRDDRHVLPVLTGYTRKDLDAFLAQCRAHDRTGDDRLAYVAVTRARDVLIASGHWWGPTQKGVRGPSPYLEAIRGHCVGSDRGGAPDPWADPPAPDESGAEPTNPMLELTAEVSWPVIDSGPSPAVRAVGSVTALRAGAERDADAPATPDVPGAPGAPGAVSPHVAAEIAQWDAAIAALRARASRRPGGPVVALPDVLSASATMDLAHDPQGFAERLVRPMPRRRNRHADLGTAFHAWVEARLGVQPLITDDELPGAADEGIESTEDLAALKDAFEDLPYASRSPAGLEVPFSLPLGGRMISGRIDAVFPAGPEAPEGTLWEVVDWKTSARDVADPLQLALYRLAWAQLSGTPVAQVAAAFVFVRSGSIVRPDGLPDAAAIADLIAGEGVVRSE